MVTDKPEQHIGAVLGLDIAQEVDKIECCRVNDSESSGVPTKYRKRRCFKFRPQIWKYQTHVDTTLSQMPVLGMYSAAVGTSMT